MNYALLLPEFSVLATACVALITGLFSTKRANDLVFAVVQIGLLVALYFCFKAGTGEVAYGETMAAYSRGVLTNRLQQLLCILGLLSFTYARPYLKGFSVSGVEYYVLSLLSMLGMFIMLASWNMLTLYLGLELMSLPLYALVAMQRDSARASEAAIKYFILGAIASGLLLYGFSLWYGSAGAIDFTSLQNMLDMKNGIGLLGLVFVVAGVAFKFGAVPFHMWVPDIYHGSPGVVTFFLGSLPKVASYGLIFSLFFVVGKDTPIWKELLLVIAMLSIAFGNVVAIAQTNFKRMLAYSSIAHMGFLFLGAQAIDGNYSASMFYVMTYSLTALAAFAVVVILARAGVEAENIDDLRGLNSRHPWLAFLMLVLMFSMAGVPPTVGFMAKLLILQSLVNSGLAWLAIFAVVAAVIGAYYYLRVIRVMYFEPASEEALATPVVIPKAVWAALSVNVLAILVLGLQPQWLIDLCSPVFPLG